MPLFTPPNTGRAFGTQRWYGPVDGQAGADAASSDGVNILTFGAFPVGVQTSFDAIGIWLATPSSGTNMRLGIYNTVNGLPSVPLLDSGVVSSTGAGAAVIKSTATTVTLTPALYWLATGWQGTGTVPSVTQMNVANNRPYGYVGISGETNLTGGGNLYRYYSYGGVSGALPTLTPGSISGGNSGTVMSCFVRSQ